ncbi:MAG TPA: YbdD/YjiX family protein [Gemmatimonadales bacterium]
MRNGSTGENENLEAKGQSPKIRRTFPTFPTFPSFPSFPSFLTFLTFLRRIAGMPDYQRHLEHLQRCHPERPIPTEKEYYEEFLAARYQDGPTRCC